MTAIAWSDVTAVDSALSSVSAGYQTQILAYVNGDGVAEDKLDGEDGTTTKLARTLLAAHMGVMSLRGAAGGTGQITGMSEGGVSISYAQPGFATLADDLKSTPHGVMFSTLINRAPKIRGFIVG